MCRGRIYWGSSVPWVRVWGEWVCGVEEGSRGVGIAAACGGGLWVAGWRWVCRCVRKVARSGLVWVRVKEAACEGMGWRVGG